MFTKPWDVNVENTSSFETAVSTAQQVLKNSRVVPLDKTPEFLLRRGNMLTKLVLTT